MEFDREVFDLMPSGSKTFNLIGLKMPSDKDIFFRAKQKEMNTTRISNFFAEIRVVSYAENLDLLGFSAFLYFHAVFVK